MVTCTPMKNSSLMSVFHLSLQNSKENENCSWRYFLNNEGVKPLPPTCDANVTFPCNFKAISSKQDRRKVSSSPEGVILILKRIEEQPEGRNINQMLWFWTFWKKVVFPRANVSQSRQREILDAFKKMLRKCLVRYCILSTDCSWLRTGGLFMFHEVFR